MTLSRALGAARWKTVDRGGVFQWATTVDEARFPTLGVAGRGSLVALGDTWSTSRVLVADHDASRQEPRSPA